jgi:hypothetical protein
MFAAATLAAQAGDYDRDWLAGAPLTLIRAPGGVYDFRNFKEIYLCNGLSSDLQNSCIPRKTSHEYIL